MSGRRAVWYPVALAGAALLLLACAPAARVSPAPASQAPGTDATFTRPYIEPRPTPTPPACAQGEAPPGHPLTWSEAERLRCFPPPTTPLSTPAPIDTSSLPRAPEPRWVVLKDQRVSLPEGVRLAPVAVIDCYRGRYCPQYMTVFKGSGPLTSESLRVTLDVLNRDDPIVTFEKIDPSDPAAFDFLKPYVRYPTPAERPRYPYLSIPERDATSTPP